MLKYILKCIFLLVLLFNFTFSEIILESLSGLSPKYDNFSKMYIMSDKMIGILNYLNFAMKENIEKIPKTATQATKFNYTFNEPWNTNVKETGFGALRYNLAFAAYAIASTGAHYTPAYPELTAKYLRLAVGRSVSPQVWSYWSIKGICGSPWKEICKLYNISMCDITEILGHGSCPDPIYWGNVMYSGHLAQIMTLYETFSREYSLSTEGWSYYNEQYKEKNIPPSNYTLSLLMNTITNQKKQSPISAFECEPTIIYTACNQHAVLSSILYDSIHNTTYSKDGKNSRFFNWIKINGTHYPKYSKKDVHPSFKNSYYIGATQENLEWLMIYFPQLRTFFKDLIKNRDGLVGLDGWVNQFLELWRPNDIDALELLNYGRGNLTTNNAWSKFIKIKGKELWYIRDDILSSLGMFNFTVSTATSFAIAGMGGYSKISANKSLVEGSLNFLDWCNGKKYISNESNLPMWFLDTQDGNILHQCNIHNNIKKDNYNKSEPLDNILNTANMLQGLVYDNTILRSLYNGTLMKSVFKLPYIESINSDRVNVRLAKYKKNSFDNSKGELWLILTSNDNNSHNITITINIPLNYRNIKCKNINNFLFSEENCIISSNGKMTCQVSINKKNDINIRLCFITRI